MIGLSGVGSPGTILAPLDGTSICVVVLSGLPCARGDEGGPGYRSGPGGRGATDRDRPDRGLRQALSARSRRERPRERTVRGGRLDELQRAVQERIRFYDERVRECVDRLRREFDVAALSDETWRDAKLY
jgi:Isocitrate dehydrogenase kinase/phosphatase (AceK)